MFDLKFYKDVSRVCDHISTDLTISYASSHENIINQRKKISTQAGIKMVGKDLEYIDYNIGDYMINYFKYFDLYDQFRHHCDKFRKDNMYHKYH